MAGKKAFLSILGLLGGLVAVMVLFYFMFNVYFKGRKGDSACVSGVDAFSYSSAVDSTRSILKDIKVQREKSY